MTTDKQLPVIPVLGNAFAEQAYRDSMKAAEAARSAIGQDKSKSKKDPQVPQVRSVERDSSGSEKKSGTIKVNLPKPVSENVEMYEKRSAIQPAIPMMKGNGPKTKDVLGKPRAVTEPITRKPLKGSTSLPQFAGSAIGPTSGNAASTRLPGAEKGKGKGKEIVKDLPQEATGKKESAHDAAGGEPAVSSSTTAPDKPDLSSLNQVPSGSLAASPDIFKGGKPAILKNATYDPKISFFAPDDSEQEWEQKKGKKSAQQKHDPPEAIVLGDGRMSPARSGTFARLGNVNIQSAPRVASVSGQVENVGASEATERTPSVDTPDSPAETSDPFPLDVPRQSSHPDYRPDPETASRTSNGTNTGYITIGYRPEENETPRFQHVPFNNSVPPPPGHEYRPPEWHEDIRYHVKEVHYLLMREFEALNRDIDHKHRAMSDWILRRNDVVVRNLTELILELAQKVAGLQDEIVERLAKPEDIETNTCACSTELTKAIRASTTELTKAIENNRPSANTTMDAILSRLDALNSRIENNRTSANTKMDAILSRLDALNSRYDSFDTRLNHITRAQYALQAPPEFIGADTGAMLAARGNAFAIAAAAAAAQNPGMAANTLRRSISGHVNVDPGMVVEPQQLPQPFGPAIAVPYGPHPFPPPFQPGVSWYHQATFNPQQQQQQRPQ